MTTSECKDVSELASVEFDDSLIVTLFSDRSQRVCRFSVALPPNSSSSADPGMATIYDAITVLESIRRDFIHGTPEEAGVLREKFAPALSDALVRPLTEGSLRSENIGPLIDAMATGEGRNLIERCASEAYQLRTPFTDDGRIISCGLVGERSFSIQARAQDLAYGILFPAY
ncbi:UNVERIFIED_ORG: hypothetical protein J2W85_002387 [Ensifer adhaerens]|nr:hypothetical protein [Ensifer adhaerens]